MDLFRVGHHELEEDMYEFVNPTLDDLLLDGYACKKRCGSLYSDLMEKGMFL
jgi:hypothetical protein